MANKIILKKTSTAAKVPLATDLDIGEIAVNLADQKLYSKNASGTVILVGQGTSASGTVTSVATGTGLTGGPITSTGAISLANTTVTAGSYTATNLTVDAQGRITAASSGSSGGVTSVTGTAPVVSSGGATPAISMAAASSGINGYMTGTYATKLDGIATGATNVTNTNQLTNGAGFITSAGTATNVSGIVAVANGGTGASSAGTALTNLGAQAALVSGTNIKTVNSTSLLGAGNITVSASPAGSANQVQYNSAGSFAGSANLTFDGTNLTCGGAVTGNSDESLKRNWRGYSNDFVEQLAKIKHGTYDRIDVDLTQDGVSAQSLQKLLPNSVLQNEDGILSVAYGNAAMVSVIKLAERVVEQDKRIAKLEAMVEQLLKAR